MNVQVPSESQVNNSPDLHTCCVCSSQEDIMKDKERNLLLRPCLHGNSSCFTMSLISHQLCMECLPNLPLGIIPSLKPMQLGFLSFMPISTVLYQQMSIQYTCDKIFKIPRLTSHAIHVLPHFPIHLQHNLIGMLSSQINIHTKNLENIQRSSQNFKKFYRGCKITCYYYYYTLFQQQSNFLILFPEKFCNIFSTEKLLNTYTLLNKLGEKERN